MHETEKNTVKNENNIQPKPPNEVGGIHVQGHIKISDPNTGEVIVDKRNAINYENMSIALAYSLAGLTDGDGTTGEPYSILQLGFGNGGVNVTGTGNLSYRATNTSTVSGQLYNQTYVKSVANSQTEDTENNIDAIDKLINV